MAKSMLVRLVALSVVMLVTGSSMVALQAYNTPTTVVKIKAKRFEFIPKEVHLKKGIPVILELTSLDTDHGFTCPELGLEASIDPEHVTTIKFVPNKAGSFEFQCDVYCGEGHADMTGTIVVDEPL